MKTWKEYVSLLLALVTVALCVSGCKSETPDATENSSEVTTVATGNTEGSTGTTEVSQATEATGSTESTESTGQTQVTEATQESTGATEGTQAPTQPTSGGVQNETTKPTEKPTQPPVTQPPAQAGTQGNPVALTIGSNTANTTGNGGYYYTWTATQDGTLELEMTSAKWGYEVHNLTAGEAVTQISKSTDEAPAGLARVSVLAGDSLQIIINTANGAQGTVKFTASFTTDIMGTATNPIHITNIEAETGIRVPAGQTVYFAARGQDTTMVVKNAATAKLVFKGNENLPSNGEIRLKLPQREAGRVPMLDFALVNTSASVQVYTVVFEVPVGTFENPAKLTLGSQTATISNEQGYVYKWTAPSAGTFTLTIHNSGSWSYEILKISPTLQENGDSESNPVNPGQMQVKAGEVLKITVNSEDDTVNFTAAFQ